jgi:Protein of unknown function (DUF2442)
MTKDEFETANERAAAHLSKTPIAVGARYDHRADRVMVELSNGLSVGFRPRDAEGLERASVKSLNRIEISPSGLGLHFSSLDADLYLPSILEGFLGSRRWMAAQLGKAGGRMTSRRKRIAARTNGKRGGRPRKTGRRYAAVTQKAK